MDPASIGILIFGIALGAIVTGLILRERTKSALATVPAELDFERKAAAEKLAILEHARQELSNQFKALSAEALRSNNRDFVTLATATLEKFQESARGDLEKKEQAIAAIVRPVRESLDKVDLKINEMEKARAGAYQGMLQQVQSLLDVQRELRAETGNLVQALRSPATRGRWGELQLKRVVEMAGMVEFCDFFQQESVDTGNGRLRPDMVVRLPAGRNILVDAKTPLEAYLGAIDSKDDAERRLKMADHARQIRSHLLNLGRKAYWEQFDYTPEFVVLFLPGENFFSAALESDPSLIEAGMNEKVLLATPTTLIALLRAVAYGWKQEKLAENAKQISELGEELHKRLSDMAGHWTKLGKGLNNAVEYYNAAVGSLETRVLPSARKFKEFQAASDKNEIGELKMLEQSTRTLQAPEFSNPAADPFDK